MARGGVAAAAAALAMAAGAVAVVAAAAPSPAMLRLMSSYRQEELRLRAANTAGGSSGWRACQTANAADASREEFEALAVALSLPLSDGHANGVCREVGAAGLPTTALVQLLDAGTWPDVEDPFLDDALETAIPDIAVTGSAFYTIVYTSNFTTPAGGLATLALDQVNYRVRVYVNGVRVPPVAPPAASGNLSGGAAGMYRRFLFNVSTAMAPTPGPQNSLSLAVFPPDHPGNTSNTCNVCGQGGNHDLAQDVTSQDAGGWDWIGGTPDRNTGVLQIGGGGSGNGGVAASLPVLLRDGSVFTLAASPAPDGSGRGSATVLIAVSALALAPVAGAPAGATVTGTLCVTLGGVHVGCNSSVALTVGATSWVDITVGPVTLPDVALWWPHTLGAPTLTPVVASLACDGAGSGNLCALDAVWDAGIRHATCTYNATLGGSGCAVNGVPLFLVGGNFIDTDQLRRYSGTPSRWATEVALHAAAGLNFMRLWGGNGGAPPALYAAADVAGVMLWVEGWMTGDNNGRWAGNASWPLDHALFNAAVADTVSVVRGHASVLMWVAGNELFPDGVSPPPDIVAAWHSTLAAVDYNSRPFFSSSASAAAGYDPSYAVAPTDGPYGIMDERIFFTRNPGQVWSNGSAATNLSFPFQPEIGSVSSPEVESMARFLSPPQLASLPPAGAGGANVSAVWQYHRYIPFTDAAGCDHVYAYGAPANASEYALRAGLAQYRQYQSLFEGYAEYQWQYYVAVLLWKSQAPWPAFRGALYDWYLATTGGQWGSAAANRVLHAQLNLGAGTAAVVNKGALATPPLTLTAAAYSVVTGAPLWSAPVTTNLPPVPGGGVSHTAPLTWPTAALPNTTALIRLTLDDATSGAALDVTDYWLTNLATPTAVPCANYSDLAAVRGAGPGTPGWASLAVTAVAGACDGGVPGCVSVAVNVSHVGATAVALGVRLVLHSTAPLLTRQPYALPATSPAALADTRVLPVFAPDNYFALLPGDSRSLHLVAPFYDASPATLSLAVDGWNVAAMTVPVL